MPPIATITIKTLTKSNTDSVTLNIFSTSVDRKSNILPIEPNELPIADQNVYSLVSSSVIINIKTIYK